MAFKAIHLSEVLVIFSPLYLLYKRIVEYEIIVDKHCVHVITNIITTAEPLRACKTLKM